MTHSDLAIGDRVVLRCGCVYQIVSRLAFKDGVDSQDTVMMRRKGRLCEHHFYTFSGAYFHKSAIDPYLTTLENSFGSRLEGWTAASALNHWDNLGPMTMDYESYRLATTAQGLLESAR